LDQRFSWSRHSGGGGKKDWVEKTFSSLGSVEEFQADGEGSDDDWGTQGKSTYLGEKIQEDP
jgi:hypothetical protein